MTVETGTFTKHLGHIIEIHWFIRVLDVARAINLISNIYLKLYENPTNDRLINPIDSVTLELDKSTAESNGYVSITMMALLFHLGLIALFLKPSRSSKKNARRFY